MNSRIGIGKGEDLNSAVEEAAKNLSDPDFILIFTSYNKLGFVSEYVTRNFPKAKSIGTSGTTFASGGIYQNDIVLIGFSGVEVVTGIITELDKAPIKSIESITSNIKKINPGNSNTVCLEFTTNSEEKLISTLHSVFEENHLPLIGGSVFGYPASAIGQVSQDGKLYANACTYALIKNLNGKIKVYKENLYQNNTNKMHRVTKADVLTRTLYQLDNRPAIDVYCEELHIPKAKVLDYVLDNPMGRVVGDEVYISSLKEMTKDNGMCLFKRLNENDTISFLDLADYPSIIASTQNKIKQDFSNISLIISIDCIYRYLLFEREKYSSTYANNWTKVGPHAGIVGGGEQFLNQHVNQTMVCAVFE